MTPFCNLFMERPLYNTRRCSENLTPEIQL